MIAMDHEHAVSTLAAERYHLREMSDDERDAFEEHYFSCPVCAEDVRVGTLIEDGAKAGWAAGRPVVARMPPPAPARAWYAAPALPWALAATLAVAAGYQTLRQPGVDPGGAGPQALSPVTLRDSSRGAEPAVAAASGVPVTLALDVNAGGTGELEYDLAPSGGAPVFSGRAPAPAGGAPLLLLIPDRYLATPGRYQVSVRDAATNDIIGEFHFVAEARP